MSAPTPSAGTQGKPEVAIAGGGVSGLYAARRILADADARGAAGWVEGALTATEVTLQRHLGLRRPPSWLPDDYYLGW